MGWFLKFFKNEFSVKNCENLDQGNGHGKSLFWSWKVMEKSWNFIPWVSWEPWLNTSVANGKSKQIAYITLLPEEKVDYM